MVELLNKLETLKERGLIDDDEVIKLRGNIQRNRLSASLVMSIIIKLSNEIEALKDNKSINLDKSKSKSKE